MMTTAVIWWAAAATFATVFIIAYIAGALMLGIDADDESVDFYDRPEPSPIMSDGKQKRN